MFSSFSFTIFLRRFHLFSHAYIHTYSHNEVRKLVTDEDVLDFDYTDFKFEVIDFTCSPFVGGMARPCTLGMHILTLIIRNASLNLTRVPLDIIHPSIDEDIMANILRPDDFASIPIQHLPLQKEMKLFDASQDIFIDPPQENENTREVQETRNSSSKNKQQGRGRQAIVQSGAELREQLLDRSNARYNAGDAGLGRYSTMPPH